MEEKTYSGRLKILLDTGISHKLCSQFAQHNYEAKWAGEPSGLSDEFILSTGFIERRIVITLDKDFGTLAVHKKQPHAGIIRLSKYPSAEHLQVSLEILNKYAAFLLRGGIIIAEKGRSLRLRFHS